MQSNNLENILSRLDALRMKGLNMEDKSGFDWIMIQKDERRISAIVHDVRNGVSRPSRLVSADKYLTKWGC